MEPLEFIVFAFWFVFSIRSKCVTRGFRWGKGLSTEEESFLTDALSSDRERPFEDSVLVLPQYCSRSSALSAASPSFGTERSPFRD